MTQTASPSLAVLPLIYNYADTVVGRGFVAKVSVQGLLLAREESTADDGSAFWLEGVQPAGLADHGQTLHEAHASFRRSFTGVLFDLASEARDFGDFDRLVQDFAKERLEAAADEWSQAVQAVRERRLTGDRWGIETRYIDKPEARVTVEELTPQHLQPIVNELDQAPLIAA